MGKLKCKRGSISGKPPEGLPWIWMTREMLVTPLWAALSITARRILDALIIENLAHAGFENGNLAATYLQLEQRGVTAADIRKGLDELIACGFIVCTFQGPRVACGGDPSRYALTWLPTHKAQPNAREPQDNWRAVMIKLNQARITDTRAVRRWLRKQVGRRGQRCEPREGCLDINSTPQMRGGDHLQMRGEDLGNIVTLTPQMRSVAVRK